MMNQSKIVIIILTITALVISYFTISSELLTLDRTEEDLILGVVSIIGSWFSKLLIAGIIIYSGLRLFKNRITGFIIPLAVSAINLIVVMIIKNEFDKREASPVIFQAHYDGDINGITLYLRKNNTYKIDDFAFLGGTSHYGKYKFNGDTIVLSKKYPLGEDRDIMSNKLLKGNEYVLIKPDSSGQYNAEEYFRLRIIKKSAANMH